MILKEGAGPHPHSLNDPKSLADFIEKSFQEKAVFDPALDEQTRVAEKRYKELNGSLTILLQEGVGHYPTAPPDPKPAVDFILKHQ